MALKASKALSSRTLFKIFNNSLFSQSLKWVTTFARASDVGFAETKITVNPNQTVAIDDAHKSALDNQVDILSLFPEPSYDELKDIFLRYIMPSEDVSVTENVAVTTSPSALSSKDNSDVDAELEELFAVKK